MDLNRISVTGLVALALGVGVWPPAHAEPDAGSTDGRPRHDQMLFEGGDRLSGEWVSGFGEDDGLSFRPVHGSAPAEFLPDRLASIVMKARSAPGRKDREGQLELAGGDLLPGDLVGITADKAVVETWFGGRIEVDRSVVSRVIPSGRVASVLYEGPGTGSGWIQAEGGEAPFAFRRGVMIAQNNGMASLRLEFPEQYQIEFDVVSRSGRSVLQLGLQVNRANEQGDGVWVELRQGMARVATRSRGRMQYLPSMPRGLRVMTPQSQRVHIMVDRAQGQVSFAVDGQMVQTWAFDANILNPRHRHLVLNISNAAGFELSDARISVWDGKPPAARAEEPDLRQDLLRFVNEDTLSGTLGGIEDGRASFETAFATMEIPVDRIESIQLAGDKRAPQFPDRARRVRISFWGKGALMADLRRMEGETLTVHHPAIGEFTIPLAAVERIDFNLDAPWRRDEPFAAAPADSGPAEVPPPQMVEFDLCLFDVIQC